MTDQEPPIRESPVPGDIQLPNPVTPEAPPPRSVQLSRTWEPPTADELLWAVIKDRTRAVQFGVYKDFMDKVLLDALGN
jgi:hypothetical protein